MPTVEFVYDYASPWSYIASELLATRLPGVEIRYRPTYLRALESFQQGIPYAAGKLQYLARDLARCAQHEGVPLKPPHAFPVNGLHALRGALLAQKLGCFEAFHRLMFRATWAESRDISTRDAVAVIAREHGFEPIAAQLDDPEIKAKLREDTDAIVQRGVFGVPTFFVGDEMFWGHDRLDYVARAAAG